MTRDDDDRVMNHVIAYVKEREHEIMERRLLAELSHIDRLTASLAVAAANDGGAMIIITSGDSDIAATASRPYDHVAAAMKWEQRQRDKKTRMFFRRLRRRTKRLAMKCLRQLDLHLGGIPHWRRWRGGLWFSSRWMQDFGAAFRGSWLPVYWTRMHAKAISQRDQFTGRWVKMGLERFMTESEDHRDQPGRRWQGMGP